MQRFFAGPDEIDEANKKICIHGEDVNHIKNVLRMRPGDEAYISDGERYEYKSRLYACTPDEAAFEILWRTEPAYELPSKIWLFQGLPKGDKMEFIIQKAVELGACGIVPVRMKRCVMRLDEKRGQKKADRWQQIARSAAEQSKRMLVPEIRPITDFEDALKMAGDLDILLAPYELSRGMDETREILHNIKPGQSVGILIGPEGGFEEEEIRLAMDAGAKAISLGHRILRTETAGMTLLSALMLQLDERNI